MENGSVRSDAAPSRVRLKARRRQLTKLSPNWRRRARANAPVGLRIITSAMRCRSCERKDFYDCGSRSAERQEHSARVAERGMSMDDLRTSTFRFGMRVVRL